MLQLDQETARLKLNDDQQIIKKGSGKLVNVGMCLISVCTIKETTITTKNQPWTEIVYIMQIALPSMLCVTWPARTGTRNSQNTVPLNC